MAGLKTSSLFPCPKEDRAELLAGIRALNARLVPKGLRILPVKTVGDRELLYLYRPARLRRESDFPHEVGLFLGYPPRDVEGFIREKARRAKCTGAWKVYGDEEVARKTFALYKRCTRACRDDYLRHRSLERLIRPGS